ncbi:hypothetical protein SDC9_145540 [bioreactor metagenome]|uniref:Uncharacterized protein n=1 Tax=bioreactor metagenome TaxID=1076179 RepID=A0A645E8Q2_9ZZZZ
MFHEFLIHPVFILAQNFQILAVDLAAADDDIGQCLFRNGQIHILRRNRIFIFERKNTDLAVRLHNGILHIGYGHDVFQPHLFDQIVQIKS